MRAEPVALMPLCAECSDLWMPDDEARWLAFLTDEEPPGLAFYCPQCGDRESGGSN